MSGCDLATPPLLLLLSSCCFCCCSSETYVKHLKITIINKSHNNNNALLSVMNFGELIYYFLFSVSRDNLLIIFCGSVQTFYG